MSDYPTAETDLPLFRASDPVTSQQGAEYVTPSLGRVATLMLSQISQMQNPTANEAARECQRKFGGLSETYRKRAGELERNGHICVSGERRCGVTGRNAQTYRPIT